MRLVVNAGTADAWERQLPNGTYSLGRAPENDIVVEHDSVSHTHCQLTIAGTQAVVKDVGSTNGTTLDDQIVEEANLFPGQMFKVGDIQMQFLYRPTQTTVRPPPRPPQNFFKLLPGAFAYPLTPNGLILLIGGGVFFVILGVVPFIGLILTGYIFNYAQSIVESSGQGEDDPPDWPDVSSPLDDIVIPLLQLIALTVLCFGPAIALDRFLPQALAGRDWITWGATLLGAFLFPMGMLAVSVINGFACLNPLTLVLSIARIPGQYMVAALMFSVVILTYLFSEPLLAQVMPSSWLVYLVAGFVNIYLLAVAMRILGLLYRTTKTRLGWFSARQLAR